MSATHTEALSDLKRQHAEEATAARTIDAEVEAAHVDLAHARDAVVTAHADQDAAAVKKATAARDNAEARVAELADRQAAARIRVQRAQQAAQAYEAEHALDLIAELEPDAAARERMQYGAAEFVAGARDWQSVSTEVTRLLRHVTNTPVHHNANGEHKLSPIIKILRQAGEIESAMPHWLGERGHQTEQRNRRLWRSQRDRKRVEPSEVP